MLQFNANNLAVLAAVCLLEIGSNRVAHAQGYTMSDLGVLPGTVGGAPVAVNGVGQAVGFSDVYSTGLDRDATEWSNGSVTNLGGLPGSTNSVATAINDAGQSVGYSQVGGATYAVEWNNGVITNLGGLPGSVGSSADGINDVGQVVGGSQIGVGGPSSVALWSGGAIIDLGGPGSLNNAATGIDDAGQVVGFAEISGELVPLSWSPSPTNDLIFPSPITPSPSAVPEPSTWAMMLLGVAGLAFAGYRGTRKPVSLAA
jgi:probable HAF family extracellular repeat protein